MKRNIPITVISLAALALVGCAGNGPGSGLAEKQEQQLKGSDLYHAEPDLFDANAHEGGNGKDLGKKLYKSEAHLKDKGLGNTEAEQYPVADSSAKFHEGGDGNTLDDGAIKSLSIAYDGENEFYVNEEYQFKAAVEMKDGSIAMLPEVKWSLQGAIGHIDRDGIFSAMAPGQGRIIAEVKDGKKWIASKFDLRVMMKKKDRLTNSDGS